MKEKDKYHILIIDDDEVDRMAVRRSLKLERTTLTFDEVENAQQAITILNKEKSSAGKIYDCIFLDYRLPDQDGLTVIKILIEMQIKLPIVVLTGQGDEQLAVEIMKSGATDYLPKSCLSGDRLVQTFYNAMRIHHAEMQAEQANQQLQASLIQLKAQNLKLEEIALARQDFISHLTHDLRTPLVAADMMLKLFQKEAFCPLSPDMHSALEVMVRSNQVLIEMINTLLEVHCYEAGSKTFTFISCNLAEIVGEVLQELQPLALEKGIDLNFDCNSELKNMVQGDRLELRRMITNLVGNSIKFTDCGSMNVNISHKKELNEKSIVLTVADTGFGMSKEEQLTLFQRFRKGSHKRSGSGLGLHLVQRIVTAHNGQVSVISEAGKGSIFTVYLPLI